MGARGWRGARGSAPLIVALFALGCGADPTRRDLDHVLLITIDSLRADHLGSYGHPAKPTPVMDALAAGGTRFEHALTTCSVTGPAHASIFTGLYPPRHAMLGNAWRLDRVHRTVAERFDHAGYETAAFVSSAVVSSVSGLDRGFTTYDQAFLKDVTFERTLQRRGGATVDAMLAWLAEHAGSKTFVWLHLFDPHAPYDPPKDLWPKRRRRPATDSASLEAIYLKRRSVNAKTHKAIRDLYAGEVRFADRQIGRVIDFLESAGLRKDTLIVLTSDHGEELGEHWDFYEHNRSLFQGVLRVPLIVVDPRVEGGRRVEATVQLVDIAPTLLDLTGQFVDEQVDGRSLAKLVRGEPAPPPRDFAYAQSPDNPDYFHRGNSYAYLRGGSKVLMYGRGDPEVFDVSEDPGEQHNLHRVDDVEQAELLARAVTLREYLVDQSDGAHRHRVPLDGQRQRLQALGYAVPAAVENGTP